MITNFEEITEELSFEEKKLVQILIKGFKNKNKANTIKAPEIVKQLNAKKVELGLKKKVSEPRLRKLCNYIRSNGLLPLIATSNGYYVSYDKEEINNQIKSLRERAEAIMNSANGLKIFLN